MTKFTSSTFVDYIYKEFYEVYLTGSPNPTPSELDKSENLYVVKNSEWDWKNKLKKTWQYFSKML